MALELCMHMWMRPEPLPATLRRLREAGFDGVELALEPATTDAAEVRRQLADHGLRCAGGLAMLMGGRDLFHEDPYVRSGTIEYLRDAIRLCADLGGSFVTVPPTVGKVTLVAAAHEEWSWYVDSLAACLPLADELGVRLAAEPLNRFESYMINRADQAVRLAEDTGETCGVCLDIFHMHMEEADWHAAIRATEQRLVHFHVADNNRLPPGQGAVDWPALIDTLLDADYDGWLSVEFMPALDRSPLSERSGIADAGDADVSQGMQQWLRDHGSGLLPEDLYRDWVTESARFLRVAIQAAIADRPSRTRTTFLRDG